jgi:hypothetical protein
MKTITAYLKQKYPDLPSNWSVYSIWKLDGEGEAIAQIKGAIARPLTRGKNKGRPTWGRVLEGKRTFLMSMKEYHLAYEKLEATTCATT